VPILIPASFVARSRRDDPTEASDRLADFDLVILPNTRANSLIDPREANGTTHRFGNANTRRMPLPLLLLLWLLPLVHLVIINPRSAVNSDPPFSLSRSRSLREGRAEQGEPLLIGDVIYRAAARHEDADPRRRFLVGISRLPLSNRELV